MKVQLICGKKKEERKRDIEKSEKKESIESRIASTSSGCCCLFICLLRALVYLLCGLVESMDIWTWRKRGMERRDEHSFLKTCSTYNYHFATFPRSSPIFSYKTIDVEYSDIRVDNDGVHM